MSLNTDTEDVDIYSEEIEEMNTSVTTLVILQLITGVMVIPNLVIILSSGISYIQLPDLFVTILVNYIYVSILIFLVLASIFLAWALWIIKPRARLDTMIVNLISIIVHLPILSPVIILNLVLIYSLNSRRIKEIYMESTFE